MSAASTTPVPELESSSTRSIYRFGVVEVDFHAGELRKAGLRVRVQDQPLQVLSILLRHSGEIVSREEIRKSLWSADTFVDFDHGLNSAVKRLRVALDDDPDHPMFVETIPRHGYRFIAPVTESAIPNAKIGGTTTRIRSVSIPPKPTLAAVATQPAPIEGGERSGRLRSSAWRPWLVAFAIGMLILTSTAIVMVRRAYMQRHSAANRARIVLAVLPFRNLTAIPSQRFVAEGMNQELITHLGQLNSAQIVVAHTWAELHKSDKAPTSQIGRDLEVTYVLDGSTRLQGDHLRVSVQLIEVSDQRYLWAESYDETVTDLLQTQAAIATEISAAIRQKLIP